MNDNGKTLDDYVLNETELDYIEKLEQENQELREKIQNIRNILDSINVIR